MTWDRLKPSSLIFRMAAVSMASCGPAGAPPRPCATTGAELMTMQSAKAESAQRERKCVIGVLQIWSRSENYDWQRRNANRQYALSGTRPICTQGSVLLAELSNS